LIFDEKLDPSLLFSLNDALACGRQFGQDLIFTYGPWGFLFAPFYHPGTYASLLGCYVVLSLVLFACLWQGVQCFVVRIGLRLLWVAGILVLMTSFFDAFFYPFSFLLLFICFFADRHPRDFLLAALMPVLALISLVKFSFLIFNVLMISLTALDEILRRKRAPWLLIYYVWSVLLLWLVAGQQLGNLPRYVLNSLQVVRGYTEAVSLPGNPTLELLSCCLAALFLVIAGRAAWCRFSHFAVIPMLALSLGLFLIFKASFVRHDLHGLIMCTVLPTAILMFFPGLWSTLRNQVWHTLLVAMLAVAIGLSWLGHKEYRDVNMPQRFLEEGHQLHKNLKALFAPRREDSVRRESHAAAKRRIREQWPLPEMAGSVDCYTFALGIVLAHDLAYDPRPVSQSYVACSEKLARLNAGHLVRADGPDSILFEVVAIDGRFPSQEDSLSWLELLKYYNPKLLTNRFLILERAPERRQLRLLPLGSLSMEVGGCALTLPVPDVPVWARIEIPVSWEYRLRSLLYRPPCVFLVVTTDTGCSKKFRLVPSTARTGFLMSPLVENCLEFDALYSSNWKRDLSGKRIRTIRLVSDEPASCAEHFPAPVSVNLSSVEMESLGVSLHDGQNTRLPHSVANLIRLKRSESPSGFTIMSTGVKWIGFAHAPARGTLTIGPNAKNVRFNFGITDGAWRTAQPTDGVSFRLSALLENGTTRELWSRRLDPLNNPLHRSPQFASIDLEGVHACGLVFETLPGGSPVCDWSYWSDLLIEAE